MSSSTVYISDPTWINHQTIFKDSGLAVQKYPYWDAENRGVDFKRMCEAIEAAPERSIFVLHACAHNPTGNDPSLGQWKAIGELIKAKNHVTVFDSAYQGFASGDLDADAQAVRLFVGLGLEFFACQSYAKNFGLYNERVGCLVTVAKSVDLAAAVRSNLNALQRAIVGNPPAFGARIVARVLSDPQLTAEWQADLHVMVDRIKTMRALLHAQLTGRLATPGSWSHITTQIGMFSYTGLGLKQSRCMKEKFHVFMTDNGRISIAGLTTGNVEYVAECMDWVVRNIAE